MLFRLVITAPEWLMVKYFSPTVATVDKQSRGNFITKKFPNLLDHSMKLI